MPAALYKSVKVAKDATPAELERAINLMDQRISEAIAQVNNSVAASLPAGTTVAPTGPGVAPTVTMPVVPIGSIIAFTNHLKGTPALPVNFALCDGSTIKDIRSPMKGQVLPSLNSTNRFLRGAATSGTTRVANMPTHAHAAVGAVAGITGNIDTKGASQGASGTATVVLNGGGVAQGVGTGTTAGPDRATDATSRNEPANMDVLWAMRIW